MDYSTYQYDSHMAAYSLFALPDDSTLVAHRWNVLNKQVPEILIGVIEFKPNVSVIREFATNHVTDNSRVQKCEHGCQVHSHLVGIISNKSNDSTTQHWFETEIEFSENNKVGKIPQWSKINRTNLLKNRVSRINLAE